MRSTRRGFTLVEVMFAAGVTAVLLGVLYNVFYATTQQSYRVGARYQAMQSALTAAEVVSRELDRLVTLPVEKDGQGYVVARFGDHGRPVRVSEDDQGVSFYVPGPAQVDMAEGAPAVPLTIDLVPGQAPGTYRLRRSEAGGGSEGADAAEGGGGEGEALSGEGETRTYRGIQLRTLRFRLLSPDAELPDLRSPDDSYYLEAVIVGTDQRGKEESALSVLKPLGFPTERRYDPSVSTVEYQPTGPLAPPNVAVNPTPEEAQAAEKLKELADRWRAGDITDEELVEQAREAMKPIAGSTPTGAIATRLPRIPAIPPDAQVLTPRESGTPVIGPPPGQPGPTAILPPAPGSPPAGQDPGSGSGRASFWGTARVFDADGNEVFSTGFEGEQDIGSAEDLDNFRDNFRDNMDNMEDNMWSVADSMRGG